MGGGATGARHVVRRRNWHHLALLMPFAWQLGGAGLANAVALRPLGLPFQLVWQMAGVLVASLSIALVFWRDDRSSDDTGADGQ
jgi:hypothetical protein